MFGGPANAHHINVIRPFSRRCAIVSALLPAKSRYATVNSSRTANEPRNPFGDRFTFPSPDSGAVAVPLVGPVKVAGLTTDMAARRISAALASGYMRNPNVAVEVAEYRPFFIQGEVTTSGQFPYVYGMTARAAISTAGGFKDTADRSGVTIYRRRGDEMMKSHVGLDFPIQPGDTIVVDERWF